MTELYIHHEFPQARVKCDNCGNETRAFRLEMIADAQERMAPGFETPAGQCKHCGALSYLVAPAKWSPRWYAVQAQAKHKSAMELVGTIARMTHPTINSSDDMLDDCVATVKSLIDTARRIQKKVKDPKKSTGDLENSAGDLQNSNLKLESWFNRAVDLLAENDTAWENEEESVKEEKEDLIDSNTKFFEDLAKAKPLTARAVDAHALIRDLSNALGRLMGNTSPPKPTDPTGPGSLTDNWANAKAIIERAAEFEA